MNLADILILIVVGMALILATIYIIKAKKKGRNIGCGGCSGCDGCCSNCSKVRNR